jgi:tRNA threonylcarbamoyladenosine biosynthesis protein TsaE
VSAAQVSSTASLESRGEADTEAAGAALAATLQGGEVVLLTGPLGAGKTAFVRGLAAGLGIDPAEVSSPTFALVHEYGRGRLRLAHADLYRVAVGATADLGLDELVSPASVLAVEWPDRLDRPFSDAIEVHLAPPRPGDVEDCRTIRIVRPAVPTGYSIR